MATPPQPTSADSAADDTQAPRSPRRAEGKKVAAALAAQRPSAPWCPARFTAYPPARALVTRRQGKEVKAWEVRYVVDGWWFSRRFTQPQGTATQAREWAKRLSDDFARGLSFDPKARCFVDPRPIAIEDTPTVMEAAVDYLDRRWSAWSPSSRQAAVRALTRAAVTLLRPGAPEPPAGATTQLAAVLRTRGDKGDEAANEAVEATAFLSRWSKPVAEVTWQDIEQVVVKYRHNTRSPNKEVAAVSEQRFRADLRQFFADAAARGGHSDPYQTFQSIARSSSRRRNTARIEPVDADIVLSPSQVEWLAACCAHYGNWGPRIIAYVLVMGLCGLRPGEAAGLERRDLDLPSEGTGWVTVQRSRRSVAKHWLAGDENPEWGPLKGRAEQEERQAPIPSRLVAVLRQHLELFCPDNDPHALVFTRDDGRRIEAPSFLNEVWYPTRSVLFPPDPQLATDDPRQPKLSRLRVHDLRHAACSLWLHAGVSTKLCQRWSGHRQLSVFLNVYAGVISGGEEEGIKALERVLTRSPDAT